MQPSDTFRTLFCTILMLTSHIVFAESVAKSEKGAQLRISAPLNGATSSGPIEIKVDSTMIMMMPEGVAHSGSGHIHLAVNPVGTPKAGDSLLAPSKHFGFQQIVDLKKGERDTTLLLPPGTYRLQAILGDHKHRTHLPPVVSDVVEFTVQAKGSAQKTEKLKN